MTTDLSGATSIAGIIGWPVEASLSPRIHNAAFAATRLDWVYVAFPVRPGEVVTAVKGMRALGVRGLNVTMPHKQEVIAALDELAPEAARAGAVNTIVADGDRLTGTNTDGAGFLRFLEQDASVAPGGLRVVIVGAGGSARAVALALADAGAEVTIAARRLEQAESIAAKAPTAVRAVALDPGTVAKDADVIVNATPVGREGNEVPIDASSLEDRHIVVDLIYHPEATPLVRSAREMGAKAFNGMGMLVHQAALSFEIWTGVVAPIDAMRAAVA
ncbi:MAG: shikimate dehydrogenase [Actinomycetota bacterium]